jgi:hypothetical protein
MGSITDVELADILSLSPLIPKYNQSIDRESAYDILTHKIEQKIQEDS